MAQSPFVLFGSDHLVALLLVAAATLAAVIVVRRAGAAAAAGHLRAALATALPTLWLAENVVAGAEGWLDWQIGLPLQLCDVSLILAFVGLLTLRVEVVEPLYFFAMAGTIPALLTPELDEGFPAFRFLIYFLPHGLTVLVATVLVLGFRLVPRRGAWWRALVWLNLYALAVTPVNLILDANFLYLRAKPRTATPYDWFGPWPWYILTLEGVFLVAFLLLDQPLRPLRAQWAERSMETGHRDEAPSTGVRGRRP